MALIMYKKSFFKLNYISTILILGELLMEDFQADEMLTFEIPGKTNEIFLEEITKPCKIRGAFYMGF